ncbi:hypothetical protein BIV57_06465 [Mangrovactinospora gilvigrisea]|uniref:DUF2510 domain-containing protein n=1 Tax=Mangrovactinospora gilvigrisea TaxID=1428644 RepID=A0A1J7C9U9_9ACTN|nr:hypothetical protein [Mangrovactinospora gilvigrisea]OIV38304.1 hypothetical protein BIV57_06465 [Mangrovactinospora gilvigrisea]
MSDYTPPPAGWYPVENGFERRWDGDAWTDDIRPAAPPAARRRNRRVIGAAVAAGVILLAAGAGGTYLALRGNGSPSHTAAASPSPRPSAPRPSQGGGGGSAAPSAPAAPPGTVLDAVNGITLPVPKGWTAEAASSTNGLAFMSIGKYSCPQSKQGCVRGSASTYLAKGATAKAAAASDIAANAKDGYGTLKSHTVLEQKPVTVAGKPGYLIRWKVTPTSGASGYVESVTFPSPNPQATAGHYYATLRFGFDATPTAPKPSVMDTIVTGTQLYTGGTTSGPTTAT